MARYNVILSDNPWEYQDKQRHRPSNYRRMSMAELRAMGTWVSNLARQDAALFLWSTGPMMLHATRLFLHWGGFRYVTVAERV